MNRFFSEQSFSKRAARWITPAAVALIFVLLLWRGVSPEANDDSAISSMLADPDCRWVPFIHPLLASALRSLFTLVPAFNWWNATLFAACALGAAGCVFCFCRTLPRGLFALVLLPATFVLYRLTVQYMTFTRSAAACVVGGAMLCFLAVFRGKSPKEVLQSYIPGCLLLFLGAMIRPDGALLSVFFAGVSAIWLLVRRLLSDHTRENVRRLFRKGLCLLPIPLLVLSIYATAFPADDTPEGQFLDFQSRRSDVIDYRSNYPSWEENSEEYLAAGITQMDYEIARNWNSYDTEYVTAEKLKTIGSFYEPTPLVNALKTILHRLWDYDVAFCILLAVPFLLWDFRRFFPCLLAGGLAAAALSLYFGLAGRLPARVFESIVFAAVTFSLCGGALYETVRPLPGRLPEASPWLRRLPPVLLAAALLFSAVALPKKIEQPTEATDSYEQVMDYLSGQDGIFFTVVGGNFPDNDAPDVWRAPTDNSAHNVVCLGGWETRSPDLTRDLNDMGITNPISSMVRENDIYAEYQVTLLRFVQEKYGQDVTASRAVSLPEGMYDQLTFASYLHAMPDGKSVRAETSPVERIQAADFGHDCTHWCFTGRVSEPAPEGQRLFCNATVCGERLTFAVDLKEDGHFVAVFYGLPSEADPDTADLVFYFR